MGQLIALPGTIKRCGPYDTCHLIGVPMLNRVFFKFMDYAERHTEDTCDNNRENDMARYAIIGK